MTCVDLQALRTLRLPHSRKTWRDSGTRRLVLPCVISTPRVVGMLSWLQISRLMQWQNWKPHPIGDEAG